MDQAILTNSISKNKLRTAFTSHGIKNWEQREFVQFNLITGENGAGKSRLLRAIRDACVSSKVPCIYLDFTKIGELHKSIRANSKTFANSLLYHGSLPEEALTDLVPYIEKNVASFSTYLNQLSQSDIEMVMGERRDNINKFLREQLGRELLFDRKTNCKISSRETERKPLSIQDALQEMSPGEKTILYFALAILCAEADSTTGKNFIFLIDEPEVHLHAKALVSLFRALKDIDKIAKNGQIFVASHSIFLVPFFKFEELILMQKGTILNPTATIYSRIYQDLISELNDGDKKLMNMLSSITHWSFSNYLAECLCEPSVSDKVDRNDKQFIKLIDILQPMIQEGETLRLLDYGGGSGRIAKCMQLHFLDNPKDPLIDQLKYDIYDLQLDRNELPDEDWMGKIYTKDSMDKLPKHEYDLIVLYNVLHEVDITEWAKTLNSILDLLKDDGILVFGERMVLSQGERPYGKSGYLVLNHNELTKLFGESHVIEIPYSGSDPDPTVCCAISNPRYIMVTAGSVQDTLTSLRLRSKNMVEEFINCRVSDSKAAREYAFYCQQYINSEHALQLLDSAISAKSFN